MTAHRVIWPNIESPSVSVGAWAKQFYLVLLHSGMYVGDKYASTVWDEQTEEEGINLPRKYTFGTPKPRTVVKGGEEKTLYK